MIQWIAQDNLARERFHGYYDPTRPGALSIGLDFLLTSDALSAKVSQPSTVGVISPNCPNGVNVFENWGVEEALLSNRYPETPHPANRAVFLPLDTLIHKGRATSTFTGPATSATGCCTGTTKMTLTMTAHRL